MPDEHFGLPKPVAAGMAMFWAYPHMARKSDQQLDRLPRSLNFKAMLPDRTKTSLSVGAIVGTQIYLEGVFRKMFPDSAFLPPFLTGLLTSPGLIVYNGYTMGLPLGESLSKIRFKAVSFVTLQETAFIGGLVASQKLTPLFEKTLGSYSGYAAAFTGGGLGCLTGHAFNTVLTRTQKGLTTRFRQLFKGVWQRSLGGAKFGLLYHILHNGTQK